MVGTSLTRLCPPFPFSPFHDAARVAPRLPPDRIDAHRPRAVFRAIAIGTPDRCWAGFARREGRWMASVRRAGSIRRRARCGARGSSGAASTAEGTVCWLAAAIGSARDCGEWRLWQAVSPTAARGCRGGVPRRRRAYAKFHLREPTTRSSALIAACTAAVRRSPPAGCATAAVCRASDISIRSARISRCRDRLEPAATRVSAGLERSRPPRQARGPSSRPWGGDPRARDLAERLYLIYASQAPAADRSRHPVRCPRSASSPVSTAHSPGSLPMTRQR